MATAPFFRSTPPSLGLRTAVLVTALFVLACSGGDPDGDFSSASSAPSSYSVARVSGFGSLIVNGVRYDDSRATVKNDDGLPRDEEIRLGMVVEIKGGPLSPAAEPQTSPLATALEVLVSSQIKGPVEAKADGILTVLGQRVRITGSTVFESGAPLTSLTVGSVVEVFGYVGRDGQVFATRIEREDGPSAYFKLTGFPTNLDSEGKTFKLGSATISHAKLSGVSFAGDGPVRVRLETHANAGVWSATQLAFRNPTPRIAENRADVKLEGVITEGPGTNGTFSVDGLPVNASRAVFNDGSSSSLAVGVRVKVQGFAQDGTLVAQEVDFEDDNEDSEFELHARLAEPVVSSTDGSGSFVLRGMTVEYGAQTVFERGSREELAAGTRVQVSAHLSADGTRLAAKRIKIED